ncbi:PREDICTED: DEAD-box ATP-dependent RNA helicase 42 isoform X2 [Camelina sativa]|uniref:DEAD-box ATP-dependent RNA helicase 42 isoform X2 n=1 Tax=Camelina sativa TaxID=90675 RepID=A0ABM0V6L9_CAMSA|nr:PREDICTED: DEAD-box ATP-dependent RNA helicase 42 isoform X2 [Camelina sativa]
MTNVNTVSGDGDRSDKKSIDENKVKAPNMFERAKEEFDAVIGSLQKRKSFKDESDKVKSEKPDGKKKPNMMKKAKDELKSLFQKEKPHRHHHHHKETHGRSDDINENTPVDEVKAPNVFERAKEEIEAVIDTIHPKKKNEAEGSDSPKSPRSVSPEKERAGLGCSIGKGLEKICSPWGDDKKD